MIYGQELPRDDNAERLILGTMLIGGEHTADIIEVLKPDDFTFEPHRIVWAAIRDVFNAGSCADYVTVANQLKDNGDLARVGGLAFVVSLSDGMPSLPSISSYVKILQEKSIRRRAIIAAQNVIDQAYGGESSEMILTQLEKATSRLRDDSNVKLGDWLTYADVIGKAGGFQEFYTPASKGVGIQTPWPCLTEDWGGLHAGEMITIAGRPSMGKSVVGLQIAAKAAEGDHGAAYLSLEMKAESLFRRLTAALGRVDFQSVKNGNATKEERQRINQASALLDRMPIVVQDSGHCRTMPALMQSIRKLVQKMPLEVLVIDHLQLMRGIGSRPRHEVLSEISHDCKHIAVEFDLCVVVLSQLNRQCEIEKRKPVLSDLKETGSIEEDSDVVMFVHRPEQYDRTKPELRGMAEFITAKQREGPTGSRPMVFRHSFQRFEEQAA